jgi:hypothetical protein
MQQVYLAAAQHLPSTFSSPCFSVKSSITTDSGQTRKWYINYKSWGQEYVVHTHSISWWLEFITGQVHISTSMSAPLLALRQCIDYPYFRHSNILWRVLLLHFSVSGYYITTHNGIFPRPPFFLCSSPFYISAYHFLPSLDLASFQYPPPLIFLTY